MKNHSPIPQGMRTFYIIWFGQLISTLGSGLTGFAMGVWLFQQTESVTLFALNVLAFTIPNLIVTPFAGALADRWDRRAVMILSDAGAGAVTLIVWILLATHRLEFWHIYITSALASAFNAFQWPAYGAATTMLVPKEQLGRAGGMTQIGDAISQLFSPALAGLLYVSIGLQGIILIDFVTFLFAVSTLAVVRIPRPEESAESKANKGSLFKEAGFGWKYIIQRPGLTGLLIYFAAVNFLMSFINPLFTPYLLGITTPDKMGYVVSFAGVGMLAGTLVMSAWGGPKVRVRGLLFFGGVAGVAFIFLGLRPSLILIAGSGFLFFVCLPIMNALSQAIWQSKVAADVQGRVFAVRRLIASGLSPIGIILAGPVVDKIFEPALSEGGFLAQSVGLIYGVGPGRGIGFLFSMMGVIAIIASMLAYFHPRVRNVESELPDAIPDKPPMEEEQGMAKAVPA
ncbi:MAG TPA: MFS transporter [Anaerolineales bacterium]|nr:MFS transporter [Anaerolineales bacterium]